jgi:dihydroxyacetone kinase
MKKLVNAVADVVDDMLSGLVRTTPGLTLLGGHRTVLRADFRERAAAGKVALISGGGSGHEPAHAGYVGPGLLTAAVCGDVFTSPSVDAVLAAIRAVAGPAGALLIVKNYTGDCLNFGLAAELARAEGHKVDMVVVADDAALSASDDNAGKRGIAGTVLIHKLLGAVAENGETLDAIKALGARAGAALSSMGVALGTCIVPAAGKPNFVLPEDEIEFGLGIHGEPGIRREKIKPAADIVAEICAQIFKFLPGGSRIALLVNDLGATTPMELSIVANEALIQADKAGLKVERVFVGRYLTALEMPGVSLSALPVDDGLVALLDAPAPAWKPGAPVSTIVKVPAAPPSAIAFAEGAADPAALDALSRAMEALEAAEEELTALDRAVGDGDIGINLARGARAVLSARERLAGLDPASLLATVAEIVRRDVGGTSGALYGAGVLSAAMAKRDGAGWAQCLLAGAEKIAEIGRARIGDGTMVDAVLPAARALVAGEPLDKAIEAGRAAMLAASQKASRRGRASYLGDRAIGNVDPGAQAVLIWLGAIARAR